MKKRVHSIELNMVKVFKLPSFFKLKKASPFREKTVGRASTNLGSQNLSYRRGLSSLLNLESNHVHAKSRRQRRLSLKTSYSLSRDQNLKERPGTQATLLRYSSHLPLQPGLTAKGCIPGKVVRKGIYPLLISISPHRKRGHTLQKAPIESEPSVNRTTANHVMNRVPFR